MFASVFLLGKIIHLACFPVSGLMLFIISDKLWVVISQRYHINILVFLRVKRGVYDIVIGTFWEPIYYLVYHFTGFGIMAVEQAFADQAVSAVFWVSFCGGRIHINDCVLQITYYDRSGILLDYTFEKCGKLRKITTLKQYKFLNKIP